MSVEYKVSELDRIVHVHGKICEALAAGLPKFQAGIVQLASRVEAWDSLRELLSIVGDAKKSARLLDQLERRLADIKKAETKLSADRELHKQKVARDRESLEAEKKQVRAREVAVWQGETRLAGDKEQIERAKAKLHERNGEGFYGGLSREPA
jgi:chromosome segregation ATPase